MKIVILASGSKGNATYIETKQTKILIDAGISRLQIKLRLAQQGIEFKELDAIFISHEHTDHVSQLPSLLKKTNAKLFINENCYSIANSKKNNGLSSFPVCFITSEKKYVINDLVIVPIQLSHDSVNCYGFLCKETNDEKNITYASITDTGIIPERYHHLLSSINVLMIESNHDLAMLKNSGRDPSLIYRIMSNSGHLSNDKCAMYLHKIISDNNKVVILGHISEDCNKEDLAYNNIETSFEHNLPFKLMVAKQYEALPMIEIK